MKRIGFLLVAAVALLGGCEKDVSVGDSDWQQARSVRFEVTVNDWKITRALTADGQDMTDLWLFDYMDGELVTTLHKVAADADFSTPSMTLAYGEHTIYFVASRGKTPTVSGTQISWATPSDTFWKAVSVDVTSGSGSTVNVALDRVVTKFKVTVTDEVPDGIATLEITPSQWWCGLDYTTGVATSSSTTARTITVPASFVGTSGTLTAGIFGISGSGEWTADMTVNAKNSGGGVIGAVSLEDVPFVRNRVTEASGSLFAAADRFEISLNTEWLNSYEIEW